MKKKLSCILLSMLFVLLLVGCGNKKAETVFLPYVEVGSSFKICVDAHSGTPYRWETEIKPREGIEYISREFVPTDNNPDIIGGGDYIYMFKAVKVGEYKIKFSFMSITDTKELPTKIVIYQVTVK